MRALQPLVIVGAGGHGRELLDIIEAVNAQTPRFEFLGFADDGDPDVSLLDRRGTRLLGPLDAIADLDTAYAIGIGDPAARAAVDARVKLEPATLVHPTAVIGGDNRLGPGLVMAAHSSLTTNVTTGRHVHLNRLATVGHDCVLGDHVIVHPGATVSGNVTIGPRVSVGTGANLVEAVTIGADTVIGAGAVVIDHLAAGVTAVGVPARPLPG